MSKRNTIIKKIILFSLPIVIIGFFFIAVSYYGGGFRDGLGKMFSKELFNQTYQFNTGMWIFFATIVGSIGLVVASMSAQSLTKNPLADASTLGTINSVVFLLLIALAVGLYTFVERYIFAVIGGGISAIFLFVIVFYSKRTMTKTKVILAGLAISIIFKTLSFFIWKQDRTLGSVFSAYTLGGAENIYAKTLTKNPWMNLLISSILIFIGFVFSMINAKGMTALELGDDKAKGLGINAKKVRIINVLVLVLTIPSAVVIVGNVAFIGLISIHSARLLLKSNNMQITISISLLIGIIVSLFGLIMFFLIPRFTSSIWTTIIGSPLLIYLAWRRL